MVTCPYYEWANYPECNKENCPLLHPELLGDMIWEDK